VEPSEAVAMQTFAGEVDVTEGDAVDEWPLSGSG
jgi:hypothetical protein